MEQKKQVVETNADAGLSKSVGLFEAMAIVIGMVIGSGIFVKPAIVFKNAGAPGMGILAWILGGIITMASGLTVAEVGAAIPKTGGLVVYLKELYGEKWAFLLGWVQTIIYIPGSTAALGLFLAAIGTAFVPMSDTQQKIFAIGMMALLMFINAVSTKFGSKLQAVVTVAKLLPVVILVVFGFAKGTVHDFTPMVGETSTAAGLGAAILGTLWAYDGWLNVSNMAGEMKNPAKDLPKAIVLGLSLVMVAYVSVNLAVINVLPMDKIIEAGKSCSAEVANVLFGAGGGKFITAGIFVSIFGALNGWCLTGARVPLALAQDGLLPFSGFFGKVSNNGTPVNAMIFQFVVASLLALTGSADMVSNLVIFIMWIFYLMGIASVFILRSKHPNLARPYSVPLYPITPIIGLVGGLYIVISTIMTDTMNSLYGLAIAVIGLPVYYMIKKK
ncbi:amino acid permease [Fervidicella metallireducens AeB]|uniref:Amino acid permease n=1 Tax=Fervidicella metallireducens AeB TaxID=1403537 RepID=A0A017RXF5_9CLOT|nr:amino acid permease [Fervidicella metallireducens]EYE89458.1 amino acid permease [Fervidicella metallireducens AeB]